MSARLTLCFAGGGTGGHVYPGLALAGEVQRIRPDARILWVGTADRVEAHAVPRAGYPIRFLDVSYLKGRRGGALLKAAASLPGAGWRALRLVREEAPAAVIGLGGFVSGPVCMAAAALGVPVFLLEQNATPGATNRLLARFATRVYATFDASLPRFPKGRAIAPGNPIRRELIERFAAMERVGHEGARRVLVVGGSQGARSLNERMPPIAASLASRGTPVSVRHATGRGGSETVAAAYRERNVDAQVSDYIDDMGEAYSWADLVVCRSGATTISELTAIGLPALYVPFPFAADDHQTANARAVVDAGGGEMVSDSEFRTERPVEMLGALLGDPPRLLRMANAARGLGRPEAGAEIARDLLSRIGGEE